MTEDSMAKAEPIHLVVEQRSQPSKKSRLEALEPLAGIPSLIAIPVVLAVIGGLIQGELANRTVSQEYVKLAVSILTADTSEVDPSVRSWAVDLLNDYSPTKFSAETSTQLKEGLVSLPALRNLLSVQGQGGSVAVSPDGAIAATGHADGIARLWELSSGEQIGELVGHTRAVTSVAFSPDGASLATGSLDRTARVWNTSTFALVFTFRSSEEVVGVSFNPDGVTLITRSKNILNMWSLKSGQAMEVRTGSVVLGTEG